MFDDQTSPQRAHAPTPVNQIWSGAQTGADQGGLFAAEALGIATGGWCPRDCWTQTGPRPDLITRFGLQPTLSAGYRDRTVLNVSFTDGTLWVGRQDSPGGKLTIGTAWKQEKAILCILPQQPIAAINVELFREWLHQNGIRRLNVAGNREETNPGIQAWTQAFLLSALRRPA